MRFEKNLISVFSRERERAKARESERENYWQFNWLSFLFCFQVNDFVAPEKKHHKLFCLYDNLWLECHYRGWSFINSVFFVEVSRVPWIIVICNLMRAICMRLCTNSNLNLDSVLSQRAIKAESTIWLSYHGWIASNQVITIYEALVKK